MVGFLRKLTIARQLPRKGQAIPTAAGSEAGAAVFLTPQSIVTFPVASVVVSVLWKLASAFWPIAGKSPWVPLIIAIVIGTIIFAISLSDNATKPQTGRQWFVAIGLGTVNSLFLAASALGLLRDAMNPK
jgi:hypothetical protein